MHFDSPTLTEIWHRQDPGQFEVEEKLARQHLCRAQLSGHVDPRRVVAVYNGCLAQATLVESGQSVKRNDKQRAEAMKLAMRFFPRYVRAMQGGEEIGRVEAQSPEFLVQSWYAHATAHLSHLPKD